MKAFKWIERAANLGNPLAEFNLGYLYHTGKGIIEDWAEAAIWIKKALAKGEYEAEKYFYSLPLSTREKLKI